MSGVRYRVRHETVYEYGNDVVHSHQLLHLVPRPSPYQQCLEHSLTISPAAFTRRDENDAFGNPITRVEFEDAHRRLDVCAQMEVEVYPRLPIAAADTLPWEQVLAQLAYRGRWPSREVLDACRFRHESPYVHVKQVFNEYGADCFLAGRPVLACAHALMQKIYREFTYAPGETSVATPLGDVFKSRRGVCQDFAHLMIACLRARGLPARYVSGYIRLRPAVVHPPIDDSEDCEEGGLTLESAASQAQYMPRVSDDAKADAKMADAQMDWVGAGQSHAWVSVYIPPFGWLELDPTNNVHVGTDHIAIASGRDFGDVSPLRGVILGGGSHTLSVCVTVEPQYDEPRTTH